ncbi:hypothetical protein Pla52n_21060 [Stieleria varia]|uniref:Uncharacterized protein n=1 Tax=Stieleria varia TaxID=2528005 RepID=A0A5C6B245_9BACT|nr:hypothetical protein Pla52n_21060 [Stieleria varia]
MVSSALPLSPPRLACPTGKEVFYNLKASAHVGQADMGRNCATIHLNARTSRQEPQRANGMPVFNPKWPLRPVCVQRCPVMRYFTQSVQSELQIA